MISRAEKIKVEREIDLLRIEQIRDRQNYEANWVLFFGVTGILAAIMGIMTQLPSEIISIDLIRSCLYWSIVIFLLTFAYVLMRIKDNNICLDAREKVVYIKYKKLGISKLDRKNLQKSWIKEYNKKRFNFWNIFIVKPKKKITAWKKIVKRNI